MKMDFDVELSATAKSLNTKGGVSEFMMMHLLDSQSRNVELLAHLASYSELLVVVAGPEGSGKSVIANALAAQRETPEDTLFLTASVMLGMPSILSSVANHWDMPAIHDDGGQSREAIRNEALARAEEGGNLLIIIDQADQLDPDTLNDIAHFALLAPQAISFALFGLPGYEGGFRHSPAQAPVHILTVEPINDNEASVLLANVYGDGAGCPLDSKELEQAIARSGALPGKLLAIAEQVMSSPRAAQASARSDGFPLRNILGIAAIATSIVMLVAYQLGSDNESPAPESLTSSKLEAAIQPQPVPDQVTDYNYSEVTESATEPKIDTVNLELASVAPAQTGDTGRAAQVEALPVKTSAVASEISEKAKAVSTEPSQASSASKSAPKPVEKTAIAPSVADLTKKESSAKPQQTYTADEVALLKPESGYIVQLLGSSSADGANAFKGEWQAQVTGTLYQYEAVHNSKPWFVVVSGVYASKAEARAAVNALPPKLRSQSPWVRPLSDAQNALR
jgi:DamX protein